MYKIVLGCIVAACFLLMSAGTYQDKPVYVFEKRIPVPGDGSYDYLAIDKASNRLYVSHGTAVNIIDLATETYIGSIEGMKGVHGIAFANEFRKGFITDGLNNSVVIFDLLTMKKIMTIGISGKNPDAVVYDPYSKKVFAFNNGSRDVSVIDALSNKEVRLISLDGAPEFAVADGKGKLYNNLEDINSVAVIDTRAMKVNKFYSLIPSGLPTGIALDVRNRRLFSGCKFSRTLCVIDQNSGRIISRLPIGAKVDAVAYDPATRLIFASCSDSTTTIIQQQSADYYKVIQTLGTRERAKTLALDPGTHKIYLSAARYQPGSSTPVPNSFEVLVYKMQ